MIGLNAFSKAKGLNPKFASYYRYKIQDIAICYKGLIVGITHFWNNEHMDYIEHVSTISKWCELSTGRDELASMRQLLEWLSNELRPISDQCEIKALEHSGKHSWVLLAHRRLNCSQRVLLFGHADTVYGQEHPFQRVWREGSILRGPGVADMKSGLYVMIRALQNFEHMPDCQKIGWSVVINCDEEIGSPLSSRLWSQIAPKYSFGLGFEPSLPEHALAIGRLGSHTLRLEFYGRSAHVGRNPEQGRSAIVACAQWIHDLQLLSASFTPQLWQNVGRFSGGTQANVVADYASCDLNVRFHDEDSQKAWFKSLSQLNHKISHLHEVRVEMHDLSYRPAKPITQQTMVLGQRAQQIAQNIGFLLSLKTTGGVCDGNNLAANGLANLDNLGPLGGGLHSDQEWLDLSTIEPHIKLTQQLLQSLAQDTPFKPLHP